MGDTVPDLLTINYRPDRCVLLDSHLKEPPTTQQCIWQPCYVWQPWSVRSPHKTPVNLTHVLTVESVCLSSELRLVLVLLASLETGVRTVPPPVPPTTPPVASSHVSMEEAVCRLAAPLSVCVPQDIQDLSVKSKTPLPPPHWPPPPLQDRVRTPHV